MIKIYPINYHDIWSVVIETDNSKVELKHLTREEALGLSGVNESAEKSNGYKLGLAEMLLDNANTQIAKFAPIKAELAYVIHELIPEILDVNGNYDEVTLNIVKFQNRVVKLKIL